MAYIQSNEPRAIQTRQALQQAFVELLQIQNYHSITVTEPNSLCLEDVCIEEGGRLPHAASGCYCEVAPRACRTGIRH